MKIPVPELVQEMVLKNGRAVMKFYGSSMSPFLKEGCRVVVEPVCDEPIRIGDIVCFRSEERLVAHRVISSHRSNGCQYFLTKGDHCLRADAPLTRGEIAGRVVAVGTRTLTTPYGRIMNFWLAAVSRASAVAAQGGDKLKRAVLFEFGGLILLVSRFF